MFKNANTVDQLLQTVMYLKASYFWNKSVF